MTPARGYVFVALAAASWGTWSLFFRTAERWGPLAPELEALMVMSTMTVLTLPLALRHPRVPRAWSAWALLLLMGVIDALNMLLFFRAMKLGTVAVAVLTHSLAPIFVAALAPLVASERTRAATWVGASLALGGLTLVLAPWRAESAGLWACAAAGAGSAVFYAANVLIQKRLARSFAPAEVVAYHGVPAALVLALAVPAGGFVVQPQQAALVSAAAIGPGALSGLAFVAAVAVIPAAHAAVVALLEPLVAVVIGALVWGEPLGARGVLGGALVVLGVGVTIRRPTRS